MAFLYFSSLSHRFNDSGVDGGLAAKAIRPKFDAFIHKVDHKLASIFQKLMLVSLVLFLIINKKICEFLVAGSIALKGIGGILYCYNCLLNDMVLLFAEYIYGSLWGFVVFYWDEKFHS